MHSKTLTGILLYSLVACYGNFTHPEGESKEISAAVNTGPAAGIHRIPLPPGYKRKAANPGSFAEWLRKIALKEDNTVYLYNGKMKGNQQAQFAVLDIPVGEKDLQQCADAVMRIRAEYLFEQRRFNE